jgi:hypothetical protein
VADEWHGGGAVVAMVLQATGGVTGEAGVWRKGVSGREQRGKILSGSDSCEPVGKMIPPMSIVGP